MSDEEQASTGTADRINQLEERVGRLESAVISMTQLLMAKELDEGLSAVCGNLMEDPDPGEAEGTSPTASPPEDQPDPDAGTGDHSPPTTSPES